MRSDARARRQRIIEAACEIFRTQPDNAPLENIAEHAGVGIATLYRNFPDRAALIHACAKHMFEQVLALQEEVLAGIDAAPERHWFRYVDAFITLGVGPLAAAFAPDNLNELPCELAELRGRASHNGEAIIDAAKRHRLVAGDVSHETFIVGLLVVARPPVPGVLTIRPNITTELVDLYLTGLKHGPQLR